MNVLYDPVNAEWSVCVCGGGGGYTNGLVIMYYRRFQ